MKKLRLTTVFLLISTIFVPMVPAVAVGGDPFRDAGFIKLKDQYPAMVFNLDDLEGRKVDLRDQRGKIVMLFFWTTW